MIPSRRHLTHQSLLRNWTIIYEDIRGAVTCVHSANQPSTEAAAIDAKARFPAIHTSNILAIVRTDSERAIEDQLALRNNLTGYPAGNPIPARKFPK